MNEETKADQVEMKPRTTQREVGVYQDNSGPGNARTLRDILIKARELVAEQQYSVRDAIYACAVNGESDSAAMKALQDAGLKIPIMSVDETLEVFDRAIESEQPQTSASLRTASRSTEAVAREVAKKVSMVTTSAIGMEAEDGWLTNCAAIIAPYLTGRNSWDEAIAIVRGQAFRWRHANEIVVALEQARDRKALPDEVVGVISMSGRTSIKIKNLFNEEMRKRTTSPRSRSAKNHGGLILPNDNELIALLDEFNKHVQVRPPTRMRELAFTLSAALRERLNSRNEVLEEAATVVDVSGYPNISAKVRALKSVEIK